MNIIFKITILKEIYIFDNLRIKMMKNFYSSFKFLILLDANQKLNPQIKQTLCKTNEYQSFINFFMKKIIKENNNYIKGEMVN